MSDNAGSSRDTPQEWSQQRRCISCFSLPPSHFLLGLQSFSIHDGNPAGIARRLLTEHQRAVQRLQRKCTGQTKTEQRQQRESSSKQLIPRQSGDLQPHARGEPSLQWHDQQRPQQALWREFQEEVRERAEAAVLPATLLPTSLSLIAAPSNAEDDTEIELRAGRQQRPWPEQPFKELEDTEARVVEEAQLVACEGQADAAPALRKKTGYAGVEQLQQSPVRQHLLGGDRKDAVGALAVHAPAGEAGQRREDNCVGESARHQVAGRFQVIKRLRHPHLCAYTHMLRRGRRIYVVSEYWSLSLADLLNQQLESRLRKNRRQDAASIASSPCRCSSCVVSFKGSNVGAGHSGDAESRSNSTSITESAAKERCADGGNRCSATKNSVFCFGETLLPLMPETFLRRVMRQTLSALEYLNSCGIVHGRLSLSAIRFNAEGDVRVADWGLHYLTAHGRCSPHTQIHPPLPFISPEILMIGPHISAIPPTSAPPVMPTASTAAFAASCYSASAPLTEIRRGVTSDRPAVASGFRLAVPSARETVTDPMTPDFGMQTAPHCWLHSTTADVFSIGIILLHVLQGPPRTPLPDKLVDTLRRLTVQQQQSEEVRFTCNRQTLREAQTDKKQEHGQVISGCVTDENPEARGRPEGQHKRLIALRGFLKQKQRQHLALKQRAKQQQAKSHVTVAHQQQACTETDRHTPSVKKNHELSFHAEGRPVEEEISTQPVEASPTERSLAEETKEDGSRVPQSGAGALYWDEWNGCERTKTTEKFKGPPCSSSSVYRSESELIADEMLLQGPASCLHYLRHVERIALMLLYVHCGYEGVQKSVSFPALAGQEATRTCTGDKLGFRYREGIDAADNMLPSQALATRPQRCETPRWADACAASASICQKRSAIGSCIGEGVKHFWRQQKHHLLESLRCLLRGPCSITLQTGTYEALLKVMHPHIQTQKLQRCNWKHPVQQPHMQEVPVLATKQYFVGADKGEEAGWLAPQQDVQPVTWQQMAAAGLAPTEHETISVTLPDSCALLSEAEDVFLEFVLSAAVDWLSGTNIWPAHVRSLLCDNDGASGASYFLKGYFPSGSTGVQSTASSSEKGKPCVERVETAAALESTLTAKTTGMVSQELCDFLCLCLSLSPNDRPTPAEALNSAWLQSQETATPHAPFDPYEEQQPHRRKVPVQHRKNSVLSTTNINAGDGNMPLHSRVTTLLGKETEAALWCPQSAGAAVALLQQLYLEESLQMAVAAGLPTRGHQIDDLAEAVLPVNMQTLLQRNYGVPVEEVFYWWQLLGHDVHSTLTSRNAFRPVSSCLRIPLASVRTTELAARTSPGAALYRSASPVESAHAVYRADATKAHETSLAAARKRACLQQRRRELRDVAPTGGPSWTYKTDADGIIAGKAADGSSGRERLSTNWQRRRIPFLLPFADMWGQLHGPAGDDRNASRKMGISNSSVSGTRSSGVFKGRSSKGSKKESWNTRPVNTGACGCARNEGWVRLPSPTGGRERSAPAANLFEQVYKPCMGSSKVRDSASPEKFRTVTSICSSGLHQFGGAECFSKRTDIFEKDQSSTYSTGNCSALSADSFASEYSTTDELTANQDEMARSASKYTERGVRGSGKAYDGSLATADVAEASSFFACGLQNAGRKWTSIGFIWKEGDARIRGVGLADVLLALDAADQLPLSKAEEVIFWCHMFALPADPCALYIHAAASLSLSAPTEAAIDIPPSLRSEIWAALLHVDYAAEAAAGPFLFEQLVREASALPASKQLKSVKFFGCHEYHDVLGSAYGATQLRRLLQALLVQGFSPPHPYCTLVTPPAQSDCSTSRQSEVSFRPVFCCVSESKDNASQKYESLNAPPTQLSRSTTSLSRDVSFLRKETADPILFEAKGHPQVFDEKREFSIDGVSIRTKAGLAAAEQVSITVQGLDALAAPFLLLYETCPQLALCCLQRFLLRDWQHKLLLITTPCGGLDVACETGGRKNQNYVLDEPVQTRKQTIAESVVRGEINATGQRNLALGLPGWGSAAALALEQQLQCFRQLLAFVDPVVAAHLSRCIGLKPEVYVVPWLMTSFSHALELHQLYLLWDAVLLRPAGFVLCVAVCLVHFLRVPLLKLARDDEVAALSLLQNAAGFVHIPALSAAAAALQDALPPSILLSPLASNEPAEILRPPTSSSGGANAGAQSLTPSPRSVAPSQTTCVLPAAAAQQSAHERQTRQVWEQPEQRYRKILAESGVTEAPQPRRLSATGAAKRNAGYSSPTLPLRRSESNGKASYNGRKSVTSAERGASPTKCFEKCPCRMQMSLGQSFCISGPAIRQDGDKAKYGEGRVQLVDDASGSDPEPHGSRSASGRVGNRETLRSNKHSNMPSGAGAVHLLQQKRGGKLAEGSQCKLKGEGGGSNERFQPPMWRGRSRCKSERPLSIQEPGSKDDGGESHLQRAHGDTTYTAHEMKHGVHARARAVVAAVIKGPALMLVGSPRKIRHRNAFFKKDGAQTEIKSLSALRCGFDAAENNYATGNGKREVQHKMCTGWYNS